MENMTTGLKEHTAPLRHNAAPRFGPFLGTPGHVRDDRRGGDSPTLVVRTDAAHQDDHEHHTA